MWWGIGDDGVFGLHAECDPLDGMIIEAAINEARDAEPLVAGTFEQLVDPVAPPLRVPL